MIIKIILIHFNYSINKNLIPYNSKEKYNTNN